MKFKCSECGKMEEDNLVKYCLVCRKKKRTMSAGNYLKKRYNNDKKFHDAHIIACYKSQARNGVTWAQKKLKSMGIEY